MLDTVASIRGFVLVEHRRQRAPWQGPSSCSRDAVAAASTRHAIIISISITLRRRRLLPRSARGNSSSSRRGDATLRTFVSFVRRQRYASAEQPEDDEDAEQQPHEQDHEPSSSYYPADHQTVRL